LAIAVLREWHIYYGMQWVDWKLVFDQDLHWSKPNEYQKSSREAYHIEKQLKLQLDNALLVYSDFLQRIDSQIDEIFILCQKKQMNVQLCTI